MHRALAYALAAALSLLFAAAATAAAELDAVVGEWKLFMEADGRSMTPSMTLEVVDGELTGTWHGHTGDTPLTRAAFVDGKLTCTIVRETPRGNATMTLRSTIEGDRLQGTLSLSRGDSVEVAGTRVASRG